MKELNEIELKKVEGGLIDLILAFCIGYGISWLLFHEK